MDYSINFNAIINFNCIFNYLIYLYIGILYFLLYQDEFNISVKKIKLHLSFKVLFLLKNLNYLVMEISLLPHYFRFIRNYYFVKKIKIKYFNLGC